MATRKCIEKHSYWSYIISVKGSVMKCKCTAIQIILGKLHRDDGIPEESNPATSTDYYHDEESSVPAETNSAASAGYYHGEESLRQQGEEGEDIIREDADVVWTRTRTRLIQKP